MTAIELEDLHKFLNEFGVQLIKNVDLNNSFFESLPDSDNLTATSISLKNPGYQFNISVKQLTRIVRMLKTKGYFHDDDYEIKMREEDLILKHPELKDLHNQYKTLLYMLCDNEYKE